MIAAKALGGAGGGVLLLVIGTLMFGFFSRGPSVMELHQTNPAYDFSIVRSAENWTLPLQVRGLPAAEIAAAMAIQRGGVALRFDPTLDPKDYGGHRVVVRLSSKRGRVQDACLIDVDDPPPADGADLFANGALCRGETSLTAAVGKLRAIEGAADPRIPDLLRQLTIALFPK